MKLILNLPYLMKFIFKLRIYILLFIGVQCQISLYAQQYFQQRVNYSINVKLDDVNHTLKGFEQIEYVNYSPDDIKEIWIHLWANAYKDNTSALVKQQLETGEVKLFFADEKERGYIDSLKFKVNGYPVSFEYAAVDYGKIILHQPLKPGESINITTPFFVKIPDAKFSRLGHSGQAYYISQWFPKPAVYDRTGWHAMPYLDQGEFYSEFGTFDVSIIVPANYVVGATGELVDGEKEYDWLTAKSDETKRRTSFNRDMSFPPSDEKFKTLRYRAENVHDFAWFADKRWHVLKSEVELPHTKRKVTTWALFTNANATDWMKGTDYINDALYYYSLWNGDYIYNHCTAVDGTISAGTGMEYPMITICGGETDSFMLDVVIAHEVGHNWFYGMLASNERDHPWMDEGMNSFNEMRYVFTKYPKEKFGNLNELMVAGKTISRISGLSNLDYKEAWHFEYDMVAKTNTDQPCNLRAENFSLINYGLIAYRKTGAIFEQLRQYLGDTLFDRCMQTYFEKWKLKHPYPEDFKNIITTTSGKNLDWFFSDLLNTAKKADYAIAGIKKREGNYILTVKNKGEVSSPFTMYGIRKEEVVSSFNYEGFNTKKEIYINCAACEKFEIDYHHYMPDINRNNNSIRPSGLLRKMGPVKLNFVPKLYPKPKTQISFFPSAGWNEYNKWMFGATLYNKFIPVKKFEYSFTSLYGLGDKELAGAGSLDFNIYPAKGRVGLVKVGVSAKRFAYSNARIRLGENKFEKKTLHYQRIVPGIVIELRNQNIRSLAKHQLMASYVFLQNEDVDFKTKVIVNDSVSYNITEKVLKNYSTCRLSYEFKDARVLDPYKFKINVEGSPDYGKVSLVLNGRINYKKKKTKGLEYRLFAGGFIYNDANGITYPLSLSGWQGTGDYWADEYYFGRSETEGILSQQMSLNDGAFKLYIPYARVTTWLTSLNLKAAFPGSLPLKAFIDVGSFKGANKNTGTEYDESLLYDAGICVSLVNDALECYLPLLKSKGIKNYFDYREISFIEQIRFVLNINIFNPLNMRDNIIQ